MKMLLKRIYRGDKYTIGHLYLDGRYICDTLEDPDRGLDLNMSYIELIRRKIKDNTAIPTGTYKVDMHTISPRFSVKTFYKKECNGKLPRLIDVPAYEGVLIHCGNDENDTSGCILVGENKVKGKVINSKSTFTLLYNLIKDDNNLFIEIA